MESHIIFKAASLAQIWHWGHATTFLFQSFSGFQMQWNSLESFTAERREQGAYPETELQECIKIAAQINPQIKGDA